MITVKVKEVKKSTSSDIATIVVNKVANSVAKKLQEKLKDKICEKHPIHNQLVTIVAHTDSVMIAEKSNFCCPEFSNLIKITIS
jgi:hypothetical protein